MSYVSYLQIVNHIDIHRGDHILVSSDMSKLAYHCRKNGELFDGNLFIDTLMQKIGPTGTLVFPTYNWDFCKGIAFDYTKTKSAVGALTNIALERADFIRTKHPIYSFVVWGASQEVLCNLDNIGSFDAESPFHFFYQHDFKNLFIDVDYNHAATFVHYCEEKVGVPYRFHKPFSADYVDEFGVKSVRTYTMYVRNLDTPFEANYNAMHDAFVAHRCARETRINDSTFTLLDMHLVCDLVEQELLQHHGYSLVKINGKPGFL